jgi:hypothetical protein
VFESRIRHQKNNDLSHLSGGFFHLWDNGGTVRNDNARPILAGEAATLPADLPSQKRRSICPGNRFFAP